MAGSLLIQWPPNLPDDQVHELADRATTYALAHGLLYLTKSSPASNKPGNAVPTLGPSSAIHAPISLFPSPFPRRHFELAQRLQRTYNVLYARIAMDEPFLDGLVGGMTAA